MSTIRNLLISLLLLAPTLSGAANYYVRDGAAGVSCSDWSAGNACDQLTTAETLADRGDTIFVADGDYSAVTFNTAASGATYIYITKATSGAHGTETGWDAAYGDGVATFSVTTGSVWTVTTGYWDFDGVNGSGKTGHGFKLLSTADTPGGVTSAIFNMNYSGNDGIRLRRTEISGDTYKAGPGKTDGIYTNTAKSDWLGQYLYVHDVNEVNMMWNSLTDSILEYSTFARRKDPAGVIHGEAISANNNGLSTNNVVRYNVFEDIDGTGVVVIKGPAQSGWSIYGNVFWNSVDNGTFTPSQGIICNTNIETGMQSILSYNNTCYNISNNGGGSLNTGINWFGSGSTGNVAYNNLWYNCANIGFTNVTHDYGAADADLSEANDQLLAADPFVDGASGNFHLSGATTAGTTLTSPYDADPDGTTRGSDSTWDRGAYEYGGVDATPSAFSFTDQTGVALSTVTTSSEITIVGIDAGQTPAITVSGTGCTYNIDGGAYTSAAGTAGLDNVITARVTSSGSYATTRNCVVAIDGVSDTFSVTTLAASAAAVPQRFRGGSMGGRK